MVQTVIPNNRMERNRTMISKTWQGYCISKNRKGSRWKLYVKSIYKGKITWTTDYTYAKWYTEKTAKRLDAEIDEGIRNGKFDNGILADSEVIEEPEVIEEVVEEKERNRTMMDYNKAFAELASNRRMLEELKAIVAEQEEAIKAQMVADGKDAVIGTEHKATYKEVVSNRFDSKAFQADHKDMYEAYKKPSSSMRFTFA